MTVVAAPNSEQPARKSKKPLNLGPSPRPLQIAVAAAFGVALVLIALSHPRFGLVFQASPVIQVHLYCAVAALVLGAVILNVRKGRTFHKTAGWVWVGLMATLAIASLFITEFNPGHWSLIHILSGWTLIALPLAIFFRRRGNIAQHRRMMTYMYLGGLIIAGGFTFMPGRLLHQVFFHA